MACIVHGVAKSRTRLSDFHISQMPIKIQFNKSTVTYSCIGMQYATIRGCPDGTSCKEPAYQWGRLERQGLDPWVGKIPWERKWQPTPVFLPGAFPWTEEPAGLQSMGSQRVGHDWSNLACMHAAIKNKCQCWRPKRHWFDCWVRNIPWRRKWQPTPVFLPGKSYGQRSLAGYSPWGCKELDTTETT